MTLPSPRVPWWREDTLQRAHLSWCGVGTGAEQSLPQAPSLTFSVELVRNVLNEPASVKVDEVRLGRVEREFRLSLGLKGKAPSSARLAGCPPGWVLGIPSSLS